MTFSRPYACRMIDSASITVR